MPKHDRSHAADGGWRARIERALAELRGFPHEMEPSERNMATSDERSRAGKAD